MQDLPSQQTVSLAPLYPAHPGPASTHPLLLKPTKFSLAEICQSHPSLNSKTSDWQLCHSKAHEKPCVGSLMFLLCGTVTLSLQCLLSLLSALMIVIPPQSFRSIAPKPYLIIHSLLKNLLGPHCPEPAALQPSRPSRHR